MLEKIKDKYQIISEIGAGGMAKIYRAIEIETSRTVAIKILAPDQKNNYVHRKRFLSEIEITKRIDSPFVVKIFDANWEDDLHYIAMELIDGVILKTYINQKSRLTVDETVDLAKQLALGFHAIHQAGVVHRDIKSQNIMVGPHGQIKIIDFGIALTDESEQLTRDNHIVGSVQYMAPELINEEKATVQSDIYAFGVLIYEMLTGEVPFKEKTPMDTLRKHQTSNVPVVNRQFENVPNSLSNIVVKATMRNLDVRYKSMMDLYQDLSLCLSNERILEPNFSAKDKTPKTLKGFVNSKWFVIMLVSIGAVILLALVVTLLVVFI